MQTVEVGVQTDQNDKRILIQSETPKFIAADKKEPGNKRISKQHNDQSKTIQLNNDHRISVDEKRIVMMKAVQAKNLTLQSPYDVDFKEMQPQVEHHLKKQNVADD